MKERGVQLESSVLGGHPLQVISLTGTEALNELYALEVEIVLDAVADHRKLAERLLAEPLALCFVDDGEVVRKVHGIARDLSFMHETEGGRVRMSLTVVPRAWTLTQQFGAELFVGVSVVDVLQRKLEGIGLRHGDDFVFKLSAHYPSRELIVQYEETDYAFFERLCEHEGIVTFFIALAGREVLVLTDDNSGFVAVARDQPIPVRSKRDHPAAYDVRTSLQRRPEAVRVHDYNYRAPRLGLDSSARVERLAGASQWVEYGAHTKSPQQAQRIAKVRSEELAATHEIVRGGCSELTLVPGGLFSLEDPNHRTQRLLVARLSYQCEPGAADEIAWDSHFEAIPAEVAYRPPRRTTRPRIAGLLNARVDGEVKGHYAELDEMGRYHVQMALDRSGRTDLRASHPVRMMQSHAGAHYGMHFPLRPGTEVLLGFVDGNPDRPVIVGAAPNPETSSPVDAGNFTQNVLRTKSNNELVIEDKLQNERIRLHTPHHVTTLQLGSEEEPEVGALLSTQGHISQAARGSYNVAAARTTVLTGCASTLVGDSTVILSGIAGLQDAASRGLERAAALHETQLLAHLGELAQPPEERAAGNTTATDGEVARPMDGLWSEVGQTLTGSAEAAAFRAVRGMAEATDLSLAESIARRDGERLGTPGGPAAIVGAATTASLFARDSALIYADRAAVLSSQDTTSVVGHKMAELKSPGAVEVAGMTEVAISSAGELSVEAKTVRVVGGYYPEAEAPALDDGTSVGVMSRRDLRLNSVEDCILLCAQKNLIGSAHSGDIRLLAKASADVTADAIHLSAGTVTIDSENTTVAASDTVEIEAATVIIKAPSITLDGNVVITGDLSVGGKLDAKDDSKLASG